MSVLEVMIYYFHLWPIKCKFISQKRKKKRSLVLTTYYFFDFVDHIRRLFLEDGADWTDTI